MRALAGMVKIQAHMILLAIPHFTALAPRVVPTPMMEEVMMWWWVRVPPPVKDEGDEDDEAMRRGVGGIMEFRGFSGRPVPHECRMAMSERTFAASSHLSVALSRF